MAQEYSPQARTDYQQRLDEISAIALAQLNKPLAQQDQTYAQTVAENRYGLEPVKERTTQPTSVGATLDEFLADQKRRLENRRQLEKLRSHGKSLQEARGQNLSAGRYLAYARDVAAFKACCGSMPWDASEAAADRALRAFREASERLVLDESHSPHTFNDRIKTARKFVGWAEATHRLERIPRDKGLYAKYSVAGKARSIPISVLEQLWDASDERGRCWLLLGLNLAYYAKDISDLTTEMIQGGYVNHTRTKTGVKVKYKLWPETLNRLSALAPKSGTVFLTEYGTPMVHHGSLANGDPKARSARRCRHARHCRQYRYAGEARGAAGGG